MVRRYNLVMDLGTPITKETFIKQNWMYYSEHTGDELIEYWILPLPIDNPDENSECLISSLESDTELFQLDAGEFIVNLLDMNGLGVCTTEEQIKILYHSLTGIELDDNVSVESK